MRLECCRTLLGAIAANKPLTELLVRLSLQTVATDTLTATTWWNLHLRMSPPAHGLPPSVPALQAWLLPLTTFNFLKLHLAILSIGLPVSFDYLSFCVDTFVPPFCPSLIVLLVYLLLFSLRGSAISFF